MSAGTSPNAATRVNAALIEWADVILVMEEIHKIKLTREFAEQLRDKKVGVLQLPDIYDYMEPVLVQLLKEKVPSYVRI